MMGQIGQELCAPELSIPRERKEVRYRQQPGNAGLSRHCPSKTFFCNIPAGSPRDHAHGLACRDYPASWLGTGAEFHLLDAGQEYLRAGR